MSIHTKVSGVWQTVTGLHVRVAGTWREIQEGWVKVSGVWQQFYINATVTLTSFNIVGGWAGEAGVRVNSDGTLDRNLDYVYTQMNPSTDWVIPNGAAPGLYEVRCTLNFGTLSTSSGTGTWLALTSDREWLTAANANITIEIRYNGGPVLDSSTHDIV